MTQTGINDFENDTNTDTNTPPKPALKTNDDTIETIAVIQAWTESTFRAEAKRTLEAMHFIDDNPDDVIDELVAGTSTIELEVPGKHRAEIHGHLECIGIKKSGIDAAVNSDAATTLLIPGLPHIGLDIEEICEQLVKLLNAGVSIDTPQGTITPDCSEAVGALLAGIEETGDRLMHEPDASGLVNDAGDGWTGRPPLGFKALNGQLRKADNYHDVRNTLKAVIAETTTKAAAGRELGCASKTITRCIEKHPDRYQL